MKINITESEKKTILNMYGIITEGVEIEGRSCTINPDGTVSITDKTGSPQKIRMSLSVGGDINVVNIQPTSGGYNITGKRGITQFVKVDKISQVILFVDNNSPRKIESGSFLEPDLLLKKV